MTVICAWSGRWGRGIDPRLPVALLAVVPRVAVRGDLVWCDARGLPPRDTLEQVHAALRDAGEDDVYVAAASTPIAAVVAARHAQRQVTMVRDGHDRDFLAPFPVGVLEPDRSLANLLDGAGVESCRDLARLALQDVEVRFGADGVRCWRLARADDARIMFEPVPRALPEASLEWTDYTLRRAERLVFILNALAGSVCEALRSRGEGAVAVTVRLTLASRVVVEYPLRAARATASRSAWMRLIRLELERRTLPDAVSGIALRVDVVSGLGARQGDVFDRGFGTVAAAESALGELLDDQGSIVVEPENSAHPLLDRRTAWTSLPPGRVLERAAEWRHGTPGTLEPRPCLTLQLLPVPRRVSVATVPRHDADIPSAYRDSGITHRIVSAAGPDRVSGARWDDPYAREYFRCVTQDGALVWLYRDARVGAWYLHGWWD